jgi:hypothetical protein
MGKSSQLRKRATGKEKADAAAPKKGQDAAPPNATAPTPTESEEEPNKSFLGKMASDFPVMSSMFTVGLLMGLYKLYLLVMLQYPEMVPFLKLRPAMRKESDLRQVLIIGTQGSGTTQVSDELSGKLGLEIAHESSDTTSQYARDGTVSWFHGVRFFDHDMDIDRLCFDYKPYMGFHPAMYGPVSCPPGKPPKVCQAVACKQRLMAELGCQKRGNCRTPFRKTIRLVRHPLRTIESLVMKFCAGDSLDNVTTAPEFQHYLKSMFPGSVDWEAQSCVETMALYVLEYSEAVDGKADGVFQVETSSACDVAELAGFISDPVYGPSGEKVAEKCADPDGRARQVFAKTKNARNTGVISFTWKDLQGGLYGSKKKEGDRHIEEKVRKLTQKLGYDVAADEAAIQKDNVPGST